MTKTPSVFKDLIALEDLADITGRHPNTLRDWVKKGLLPGTRISERVYVVSKSLFLQSLSNGLLSDRFTAREAKEILAKLNQQEAQP
ncbi:helix-turn-helix domain-containing protein [Meiothermus granaticius]|uniref:Helix-turn-helix domain-containing protein n=1 Tax=Meiothermus granaticius NBRC 107808 TaxID=1227551 RepID=A0A399F6B9_9DEIN|nr:helix-turn-helix domain-containing protein [Meiothermus granaticius]RIH91778.1 hypothetical protein Mgrana_02355 [Meiothermus granaticius NBRC 107808]GEM88477.1 hypothetical protein MGR01S_31020 [Meiothermus granaticius NBRC 107808]